MSAGLYLVADLLAGMYDNGVHSTIQGSMLLAWAEIVTQRLPVRNEGREKVFQEPAVRAE